MKREMPKVHPRETVVREAESTLASILVSLRMEHALTEGEYLAVVNAVVGREWNLHVRRLIRAERHPDGPDKPGGWA